ncbi:unnamed protein product [Echinostoma caproni]|uniref:Uncharacterized protein n=1 Tax=Echinostoma caproni TaxID=27848 RepID=A0A183AHF8_9TREM|nr:unnamed protein product [Echinostoma caproni]
MACDSASEARGVAGVGIALSVTAERSLLEWITINSRPCAVSSRVTPLPPPPPPPQRPPPPTTTTNKNTATQYSR